MLPKTTLPGGLILEVAAVGAAAVRVAAAAAVGEGLADGAGDPAPLLVFGLAVHAVHARLVLAWVLDLFGRTVLGLLRFGGRALRTGVV